MARATARLRPDSDAATPEDTASATAHRTVADQVRKSLAVNSPPVTSLMYALMSDDFTSHHDPSEPSGPAACHASSSWPPPERSFSSRTNSTTAGSAIDWMRRLPVFDG